MERAYRLAFTRPPTADEAREGAAFLTERAAQVGSMDKALTDYALALLSLNEFIVVE